MTEKYKSLSLRYPGGKAKVAKKIVAQMPPHKVYVEPFAGAAHVFFQKPKVQVNVLNDTNRDLISLFRGLKGKKTCCEVTSNKEKFLKIRSKTDKTPCDLIYLNKNSYGGGGLAEGGTSFGYTHDKGRVCIDGSQLNGVRLETKDFRDVIKEHDSPDTLFYVDPPYVKANQKTCLYGKGQCAVEPKEVAEALKSIKGKAIISYDDRPDVRRAFKGFKIKKIELPYSFTKEGSHTKGKRKELLLKNF